MNQETATPATAEKPTVLSILKHTIRGGIACRIDEDAIARAAVLALHQAGILLVDGEARDAIERSLHYCEHEAERIRLDNTNPHTGKWEPFSMGPKIEHDNLLDIIAKSKTWEVGQ